MSDTKKTVEFNCPYWTLRDGRPTCLPTLPNTVPGWNWLNAVWLVYDPRLGNQ